MQFVTNKDYVIPPDNVKALGRLNSLPANANFLNKQIPQLTFHKPVSNVENLRQREVYKLHTTFPI